MEPWFLVLLVLLFSHSVFGQLDYATGPEPCAVQKTRASQACQNAFADVGIRGTQTYEAESCCIFLGISSCMTLMLQNVNCRQNVDLPYQDNFLDICRTYENTCDNILVGFGDILRKVQYMHEDDPRLVLLSPESNRSPKESNISDSNGPQYHVDQISNKLNCSSDGNFTMCNNQSSNTSVTNLNSSSFDQVRARSWVYGSNESDYSNDTDVYVSKESESDEEESDESLYHHEHHHVEHGDNENESELEHELDNPEAGPGDDIPLENYNPFETGDIECSGSEDISSYAFSAEANRTDNSTREPKDEALVNGTSSEVNGTSSIEDEVNDDETRDSRTLEQLFPPIDWNNIFNPPKVNESSTRNDSSLETLNKTTNASSVESTPADVPLNQSTSQLGNETEANPSLVSPTENREGREVHLEASNSTENSGEAVVHFSNTTSNGTDLSETSGDQSTTVNGDEGDFHSSNHFNATRDAKNWYSFLESGNESMWLVSANCTNGSDHSVHDKNETEHNFDNLTDVNATLNDTRQARGCVDDCTITSANSTDNSNWHALIVERNSTNINESTSEANSTREARSGLNSVENTNHSSPVASTNESDSKANTTRESSFWFDSLNMNSSNINVLNINSSLANASNPDFKATMSSYTFTTDESDTKGNDTRESRLSFDPNSSAANTSESDSKSNGTREASFFETNSFSARTNESGSNINDTRAARLLSDSTNSSAPMKSNNESVTNDTSGATGEFSLWGMNSTSSNLNGTRSGPESNDTHVASSSFNGSSEIVKITSSDSNGTLSESANNFTREARGLFVLEYNSNDTANEARELNRTDSEAEIDSGNETLTQNRDQRYLRSSSDQTYTFEMDRRDLYSLIDNMANVIMSGDQCSQFTMNKMESIIYNIFKTICANSFDIPCPTIRQPRQDGATNVDWQNWLNNWLGRTSTPISSNVSSTSDSTPSSTSEIPEWVALFPDLNKEDDVMVENKSSTSSPREVVSAMGEAAESVKEGEPIRGVTAPNWSTMPTNTSLEINFSRSAGARATMNTFVLLFTIWMLR